MFVRILALTLLLAGVAIAAPVDTEGPVPLLVEPASAEPSTCDGWPKPIQKVFDECPHGPTI